jgi:hypothetical protein
MIGGADARLTWALDAVYFPPASANAGAPVDTSSFALGSYTLLVIGHRNKGPDLRIREIWHGDPSPVHILNTQRPIF